MRAIPIYLYGREFYIFFKFHGIHTNVAAIVWNTTTALITLYTVAAMYRALGMIQ